MKTCLPSLVRAICFSLVLGAVPACGPETGQETATGEAPLIGDVSSYYLGTLDPRACPSPTCGGYFVRLVNLGTTPCADGTSASQCHAGTVDLSAVGLNAADAARLLSEFGQQHALVRGKLVKKEIAPGVVGDVLVASEAWLGQARSVARGTWNRFTSTGIVCVTYPCPTILGERLNTGLSARYNDIDLAASGAPAEAVAKGREALRTGGVLASGYDAFLWGPAGVGRNFRATEFYLRLVSSTPPPPPPPSCDRQDATGIGSCAMFLGYLWNGSACVGLGGCSCQGTDCANLYPSIDLCQKDHAACPPPSLACSPLMGRAILCPTDQYCDYPDDLCGAGQMGVCRTRPQVCTMDYNPVCGCNNVTYSNGCGAAASGTDVSYTGQCR